MAKSKYFLIVLLVVLITFSACSSSKDTQEQKTQEDMDVTLPENVPSNVPIYTDSTLRSTRESEDERATYFSISLNAKGSVSDVNGWYYKALQENGWTIKSDKTVAGYRIIQADNLGANLFTSMQASRGDEPDTAIISQQVQIRK